MAKRRTQAFSKAERIGKELQIARLFASREGFCSYPLRWVYVLESPEASNAPVSILISVPKRKIRKAYQRNLLKRRCREAYRLHKNSLLELVGSAVAEGQQKLLLACIYLHTEPLPYATIEQAMQRALQKLEERYRQLIEPEERSRDEHV